MPGIELDFQRIRSHRGDRKHGFEELCAQLAYLEERPADTVYYRKGLGADAGIECFIRQADGSESGWQAKFFFDFSSVQTKQLDISIQQALTKHPRLTRFIVCLPFNLKDARQGKEKTQLTRWEEFKAKWEVLAKQKNKPLIIELWDATAIGLRLQKKEARYEARIAYWFGDNFLSHQWFVDRFEQARVGLGARYTPETNVELPIRRTLLGFCRDPLLFAEIEKLSEKLEEASHHAVNAIRRIEGPTIPDALLALLEEKTKILFQELNAAPAEPGFYIPIDHYLANAKEAQKIGWQCSRAVWSLKTDDAKRKEKIDYATHELRQLQRTLDQCIDDFDSEHWQIANQRQLLVYGDAGVGKSHLFGDAVEHQIIHERPAILVLGGSLREADPWTQIIEQLGLQGISTDMLLATLDAAGQAAGVRSVIFVDAINERHGIDLWATRLPTFLKSIAPYPHVAIAVSCRTTYLPYIIDNNTPSEELARIQHVGFAGNMAAASYYLDKRGIVRMAAPNLIPEFDNPLFLKTCCDFLIKSGEKQFPRGLRGVTAIFEFYSNAIAQSVETRMKLDRGQKFVARVMAGLAAASDEGERGYIERDKAQAIVEAILPSHGLFERNLLSQLESEGVLAIEPTSNDEGGLTESVRFTFERYSDHRIAHQLLEKYFDNSVPEKAFEAGAPLRDYVDNENAYKRQGVIEALATQIPERSNKELQDLVPGSKNNSFLLPEALVRSVLWRNQKYFTERTLQLLDSAGRLTGRNEVDDTLIAIATEPENQFNAEFLHKRLMSLTMAERDHKWSVYLMYEQNDAGSHIETLVSWTLQNGREEMEQRRAELAAITLAWIFGVGNRSMRDRSTKALATLLSVRLDVAALLIMRFAKCNDNYILERIFASAYGAALQRLTIAGLSDLAVAVYQTVFKKEFPIAHLMIRDYARGILEFALYCGVLPKSINMERARPPYNSPWPLEEVTEETVEGFKQDYGSGIFTDAIVGSTVHDGDFARYVSDSSVNNWSSLPISFTGLTQKTIYRRWRKEVLKLHPEVNILLKKISAICVHMRTIYGLLGSAALKIMLLSQGNASEAGNENKVHPDAENIETELRAAEMELKESIGEELWFRYLVEAQPYVHGDVHWRERHMTWPPRFDTGYARRWICKRAHDLGWTPELFGEIDRRRENYDRMDHRVERIGKKYQWIALQELLACLADNQTFLGDSWKESHPYEGAWETGRRDIDPSVLVTRTKDEAWHNWNRTWWMPAQVTLKPVSPVERLHWLHSSDDFVNDSSLIEVKDQKTKRQWLVLSEVASWHQWAMRAGERRLERMTWFRLQSLLVKRDMRDTLIKVLSKKMITDDSDIPAPEMPWDGFLGEYPWHPAYKRTETWIPPSPHGLSIAVQPTVARYRSEISGYDYSIEDQFHLELPSPGLMEGLNLHISNGHEMAYAKEDGRILFFDPSVKEPGMSAALVDRDIFLDFLRRENLSCVWVIGGVKRVSGGKRHNEGWGGERLFSSIYWLTEKGFQRKDKFEDRKPSAEQLRKFLAEDGNEEDVALIFDPLDALKAEKKVNLRLQKKKNLGKQAAKTKCKPNQAQQNVREQTNLEKSAKKKPRHRK